MHNISTFYRFFLSLIVTILSTKCIEQGEKLKGHLKPIFSYGERLSVDVFKGFPQPSVFFRDYVSREKPVLLQNAAKSFPAFEKWSDKYFLSLPQSEKHFVTVETKKKENRLQPADELSLKTFIQHYHNKEIYMVDSIPKFLRKDVLVPFSISCQSVLQDSMIQAMMWISSGGTQSVLHNDYAENINCVVKGTKIFYIVDKKYMENLNVTELGYSDVDVDSVDLYKYPGLYDIQHYKVTVEAGDCLYIPFLWVHQVTSQHQNIAINFWWKDNVEVNYDGCDTSGKITVDEVTFVGFDSLSEAQYKMIKGRLRRRIRTKGPMTFEDLLEVVLDVVDIQEDDVNRQENTKEVVKKIFLLVDAFPTDGLITLQDVDNLSQDNLKMVRKYLTTILNSEPEEKPAEPEEKLIIENSDETESDEKEMKQDSAKETWEWKKMVEARRKKREL